MKKRTALIIALVLGLVLNLGSIVLADSNSTTPNNIPVTTNDFGNTGVWG